MPYKPIKCHLYDYIEIACMRAYELDVQLLSGEITRGIAKDTRIFNQEEYLIMELKNKNQQIRLDTIERITVLDKVAEFKSIEINPAKK